MIKMNELVKLTNTPKSTILYYIKENLLPEPYKDKPNFHLYDESNIKLLEFIKYLQSNFNASISQIKALFAQPNFDINNPYESLIHSLSLIMGAENEIFSSTQLCEEFKISEQTLSQYVEKGLLHPRDGIFTNKEREILAIITRCNETEFNLLQAYIDVARQLAQFEVDITLEGLSNSTPKDEKLKHLFDILLVLKPYVFNMETLKTYQKASQ
ncbi:MerR family transcriptional regulator [Mannheimia sp. AT1]|uniref:MerR family transcriptional regulator n=1 Tax=Mannheimia cairinae TaxID=3025936 RepID=A0ABT5MRJ4_9PAST|nr:MerR family transcriptional regulator [Mannheimia cairinae]MDD0824201.1 MerR family transcriptional regulator [Mannheimia cairinae]MDD0826676.1 MerR family transcriptional regulator [Mannheimia cairinae]